MNHMRLFSCARTGHSTWFLTRRRRLLPSTVVMLQRPAMPFHQIKSWLTTAVHQKTPISITGKVEKIIYFDESTDYCVFMIVTPDGVSNKIVGKNLPRRIEEEELLTVEVEGPFRGLYGEEFKLRKLEKQADAPGSKKNHRMVEYLQAFLRNVGPERAQAIFETFDDDTFEALASPDRLKDKVKLPANVVKEIRETNLDPIVHELFMLIPTFSVKNCEDARDKLGEDVVKIVHQNPYRLIDAVGLSFKKVDSLAKTVFSVPRDNPYRFKACIKDALSNKNMRGSTAVKKPTLKETLRSPWRSYQLPTEEKMNYLLGQAVADGTLSEYVCDAGSFFQIPSMASSEESIATMLVDMAKSSPSLRLSQINIEKHLKDKTHLSKEQKAAIKQVVECKLSIVTGGPGTGKTSLLESLVSILNTYDVDIAFAAPTGAAAQRMQQATSHASSTLHRLLGHNRDRGDTKPSPDLKNADVVVVDEASMLDGDIFEVLVSNLPEDCHLVLIGDPDQLPPVEPGNILRDIMDCKRFPETRLHVVHRQLEASDIIKFSRATNDGDCSILPQAYSDVADLSTDAEVQHMVVASDGSVPSALRDIYEHFLPRLGIAEENVFHDVQILIPTKIGKAGTVDVSRYFQQYMNPNPLLEDNQFKVGDKVMQKVNDYEKDIFNGNVGKVVEVFNADKKCLAEDNDTVVVVEFKVNDDVVTRVEYSESDSCDLILAAATTIHKSQGAEFPVVIIVLMESHNFMLSRTILYTAMTRGKQQVIIVGEKTAYERAVRTPSRARRTLLGERIAFLADIHMNAT